MQSKSLAYIKGFSVGALGKVIERLSAIGSIWLLTHILPKSEYGDYSFVFSVVTLLSTLGTGGFQNLVLLRISKSSFIDSSKWKGKELVGLVIVICISLSTLSIILTLGLKDILISYTKKKEIVDWVIWFSVLIPILSIKYVYQEWYRSNHQVPLGIVYSIILPSLFKLVFLGIVYFSFKSPLAVAIAIILSEFIPLLIWYLMNPVFPNLRFSIINLREVAYSLKLMLVTGSQRANRQIDILMVGIIATSIVTAEYAIAARLCLFVTIGQKLLNSVLIPRIGGLIALNKIEKIKKEYNEVRLFSLTIGISIAFIYLLGGQWLLSQFGDYSDSFIILNILTIAYLIDISFGSTADYLKISGHASWSLLITIFSLITNLILNLLLIPTYGALGAAFALIITLFLLNIANYIVIQRKQSLKIIDLKIVAIVLSSIALIVSYSVFELRLSITIAGCLMVYLFLFLSNKRIFMNVLSKFRNEKN